MLGVESWGGRRILMLLLLGCWSSSGSMEVMLTKLLLMLPSFLSCVVVPSDPQWAVRRCHFLLLILRLLIGGWPSKALLLWSACFRGCMHTYLLLFHGWLVNLGPDILTISLLFSTDWVSQIGCLRSRIGVLDLLGCGMIIQTSFRGVLWGRSDIWRLIYSRGCAYPPRWLGGGTLVVLWLVAISLMEVVTLLVISYMCSWSLLLLLFVLVVANCLIILISWRNTLDIAICGCLLPTNAKRLYLIRVLLRSGIVTWCFLFNCQTIFIRMIVVIMYLCVTSSRGWCWSHTTLIVMCSIQKTVDCSVREI